MPQPDISSIKYGPGSNPIELNGNSGWGRRGGGIEKKEALKVRFLSVHCWEDH